MNKASERINIAGSSSDNGNKTQDVPMGTARRLRVVCIGAGYSGLMISIIMSQKLQGDSIDFRVFEMNGDLGGTWLLNRYPGCQCDSPAHIYAYSFCPKPDWCNYYATSTDIHQYLKETSKKYDCDKYFVFRHKIISATWDEEAGQWRLRIRNLDSDVEFDDSCHVLINASGVLNNWTWPKIEGIEKFKGKLMHSACWDQSYDLRGKKVAIIGIGASGIQILPQIATVAKHATLFTRSPTWITPQASHNPLAGPPLMDKNLNYLPSTITRFAADTHFLQQHRRDLANKRIENFKTIVGGQDTQEGLKNAYRTHMLTQLGEGEKGKKIAEWIIPSYPAGCRRLTPSSTFLPTLLLPNIDSFFDNIGRIYETGIETKDGTNLDFDAVICATGFNCNYLPSFHLLGRNGVSLSTLWSAEDPECYFGTTISSFPNYFTFIGPNSPVSNGGLVQGIQGQGIYISKCIKKIQTEGIKSMEVLKDVQDEYNKYSQAYLRESVWAQECTSWYKRSRDGRVVAVYAGSAGHFLEVMRRPRWEDYKYVYLEGEGGGRFGWLGNGFTRREHRGGSVGNVQTRDFEEFWNLMELPEIFD